MIKANLAAYYSLRDKFGNCYWAFVWTDTQSGKRAAGTISGGEGNIRAIVRLMNLTSDEICYNCIELPIREFNRFIKRMPYVGCESKELAKFIQDTLAV